jgi:hypothetical protein
MQRITVDALDSNTVRYRVHSSSTVTVIDINSYVFSIPKDYPCSLIPGADLKTIFITTRALEVTIQFGDADIRTGFIHAFGESMSRAGICIDYPEIAQPVFGQSYRPPLKPPAVPWSE